MTHTTTSKRAKQAYKALQRNGIKVDPKGLENATNLFSRIVGGPNAKN